MTASGSLTTAVDSLVFGNADIAGSGNGVLLRESVADPFAQIARFGVDRRMSRTNLLEQM